MRAIPVLLSFVLAGVWCWAARCTTVAETPLVTEYEGYVAAAEKPMRPAFDESEFSWLTKASRSGGAAALEAGLPIIQNISDEALNRRLSIRNGTVIRWVGAIRIRTTTLAVVRDVMQDYDHYSTIYRPMIFRSRATRTAPGVYDVNLGLQNSYRYISIFPQRYCFQARARVVYSGETDTTLFARLQSMEVRESDSGVPGREDFLDPLRDHGIMWALNTFWRARQTGRDVYMEFETITLARSVAEFACKIGFIPVPRSIVAKVMETLPRESVELVLTATKAECERRSH
jgi:hypothetical protein